jgi:hypothetical protein
MRYEIHHQQTGDMQFGFEIQPPLSELAASGLRAALERRLPGSDIVAPKVDLTRNDIAGTALDVQINWKGARLDSAKIAGEIATLLNPAGQIETVVIPSEADA